MMKGPGGWRADDQIRSGPGPANNMAKKLDVPQSGKVGTTVNVNTRYGQIQRQYVKPRDPKTPAQMMIRSNLARVSARWRVLTEEQRQAWTAGGRDAETQRRLGRSTYLTGSQFFNKINCARVAIGLEQLDDPPEVPGFAENPVGELSITNSRGAIALKLSVPSEPAEHTLVLGAAPCSAGRSSARHFVFLGFLPEPTRAASDISDLYVARFGVPPVGTKVFIRTQQHIDGWDDLPKQTSAIVPKA
jgi:hypothetical protein